MIIGFLSRACEQWLQDASPGCVYFASIQMHYWEDVAAVLPGHQRAVLRQGDEFRTEKVKKRRVAAVKADAAPEN